MVDHFYDQIPGWFDFQDIYTEAVQTARPGAQLVEVGAWLGRSTAFMAVEIANAEKPIKFCAVDTWLGSAEHQEFVQAQGGSVRDQFIANMQQGGVANIVTMLEKPSVEAAATFVDGTVDFVFIDASHDFRSVRDDIRAWYPKIRQGGVIAGHDVGWQGLLAAVQERLPASEIEIRGTSWWHRKRQNYFAVEDVAPSPQLLYIPVVNRLDLLQKALASVPSDLTACVVDQTSGQEAAIRALLPRDVGYLRPEGRLTFSQLQNRKLRWAAAMGIEHLMFMHADAACEPTVVRELAQAAREQPEGWGVIFTHYDILCVYDVQQLVDRVGFWDETFAWYYSDIDFYRRVGLSGLRLVESRLPVEHAASATINSDPQELAAVAAAGPWHEAHYRHKWGGRPGAERHIIAYDGRP